MSRELKKKIESLHKQVQSFLPRIKELNANQKTDSSEWLDILNQFREFEFSDQPTLRKLFEVSQRFSKVIDERHLLNLIVPLERWLDRNVTDAEILVHESDLKAPRATTMPLIVIADHLRSAFNMGSIFRTSDTVGAEKIITCGYSPTPENSKVRAAALGAESLVPHHHEESVADAIASVKKNQYTVVALETAEPSTSLFDFKIPERVAVVLGNERFGLDQKVLKSCDEIVSIPVFGHKNSLNVGISFSVFAFEMRRQVEEKKNHGV